jgi:peroxisomal enoyl-CoA hydratase 2
MSDIESPPLYFDNVEKGDSVPERTISELDQSDFVRYAGASGDFNPNHYNKEYAQEAGNETFFAQGMLTAGILSHVIADWVGLQNLESFSVRFKEQVWPGDSITAVGEVTAKNPDNKKIEVELAVQNGEGTDVLTGKATASLPQQRE